jgi:SagB-type dehydrogenase family enzyme
VAKRWKERENWRKADFNMNERLTLPPPKTDSRNAIEKVLFRRRSVRELKERPLTLAELSQLLWAAQGITHRNGYRTAPSAGALYPLELYLLAGNVVDLGSGFYQYLPSQHRLKTMASDDKRLPLRRAALDQVSISEAAAVLVFCAIFERITGKYGPRGIRYVHMEAGHAAQNVYLQAESLHLGTVVLGAFDDSQVKGVLALKEEEPLYLMPVGKK